MRLTAGKVNAFIYDSSHKQVFYADAANRYLGVASTVSGKTLATFNISGAVAFDLSPDNSKLYVGTESDTAAIVVIDTANLQITAQYPAPDSVGDPVKTVIVGLNNVVLVGFGKYSSSMFSLSADAVWHNLNYTINGQFFRSGDHSRVFGWIGDIAEYDSSSDQFGAYRHVGACSSSLAANTTGSRFVCTSRNGDSTTDLVILDANFNQISRSTSLSSGTPSFSTDGNRVFVSGGAAYTTVQVFSTSAVSLQGYLPASLRVTSSPQTVLDTGGSAVLISADAGLFLADSGTLLASVPTFPNASAYVNDPIPFDGATQLEFQSDTPNVEGLMLGTKLVTSLTAAYSCGSRWCFRGNVPPGDKPGRVDSFLTHDGGTISLYTAGASMGPVLIKEHIVPRSGSPDLPTNVQIQDYYRPETYLVVNDQKIQINNSTLRWVFPQGAPGFANISVFGSSGVNSLPKGFYYPNKSKQLPLSGKLSDMVADATHKKVYVANQTLNRIEVLSPDSLTSLGTIPTGKTPLSLSLTPDNSKLLVANFDDSTIQVIDTSTGTTVSTLPFVHSVVPGQHPARVLAVTATKAIVGIGQDDWYQVIDLITGAVSTPGPSGYAHYSGSIARLSDGTVVFHNFIYYSYWNPVLNTIDSRTLREGGTVIALPNAAMFSAPYILNETGRVTSIAGYPCYASHPTALLLYCTVGYGSSGALDIVDGRTGNLLRTVWFTDTFSADPIHLALGADGRQIFAITSTGVSMIELPDLPLSVERAEPSIGSGGSTFTLHGTGFTSSTKLSFGSLNAAVSYVDEYTLRVTVPSAAKSNRMFLANADGDEYTADGVFFIQ